MIPSSLYCHVCGAANATDRSVCFACQQPLQIATSDNTPLLQGRYRILTQVGKGGFGAVYRAEDMHDGGNIVAVKQIDLRGLTPQETIEATDAFNREVSLLSNLSHPNLPRTYDSFTDPEHWYLVMDFIEGETLESYLEAKGVYYTAPLDEVLRLGIQLCTVLGYLHTREPVIIFRDLKPANIMRTPTGKLYLIDFGIARSFKPGKLKDTIPFGSPGYAAPEQYGKAQTTPRADIYSLGALMHMLLTGNDPVDNPFHFAPLRIYGSPGLADLETLILRMVHIDVERRPANVIEVHDDLQRIVEMQASPRIWRPPVGQTPPALPVVYTAVGQQQISASSGQQQLMYVPSSQRKRTSRRRFLVGGFAIAGLTVIGAGGVANIVSAFQSSINTGSAFRGVTSTSPFVRLFTYSKHAFPVQDVVWSQDSTMLASSSLDGTIQLWSKGYVISHITSNVPYVYDAQKAGAYLAWGNGVNAHLLAYSSGQTITLLDTVSHATKHVTAAPSTSGKRVSIDITSFAWSSDGGSIAFPTSAGVQIWDVAQEKVVRHIDIDMGLSHATDFTTSFSWLTDGSSIALGLVANNETLVINVAQGRIGQRLQGIGAKSVAWSPNGNCLASISGAVVNVTFFWDVNGLVSYTFPDVVTAFTWSDDSQYLIAACRGSVYVWHATLLDSTPNGGKFIDGSVPNVSIGMKAPINSLALSSADGGKYLAIGSDKAYLLEIDTDRINNSPQQGS